MQSRESKPDYTFIWVGAPWCNTLPPLTDTPFTCASFHPLAAGTDAIAECFGAINRDDTKKVIKRGRAFNEIKTMETDSSADEMCCVLVNARTAAVLHISMNVLPYHASLCFSVTFNCFAAVINTICKSKWK